MTFLYKCAKEQYISRSREDEKRDEVMGIFRRIFGKSDELVYGSSENPRPLRRVDAVEEDLRTTMEHFLELKDSLRPCIKEAEAKLLEAETCREDCEKKFNDLLLSIYDDGGNFWENKDSYPEASALWDQLHVSARESADIHLAMRSP